MLQKVFKVLIAYANLLIDNLLFWYLLCAVEWNRRDRISSSGCGRSARQFTLEELEEATKNFSESNLVGTGSFGLVYKGLLLDGTLVAIKRRVSVPRQKFVEEVNQLAELKCSNNFLCIIF